MSKSEVRSQLPARPIGTGLGTDILALFSDGTKLYGIATDATTQIGIYVINTKTGLAIPTGAVVTGLPSTNDFYVDTAALSTTENERCD